MNERTKVWLHSMSPKQETSKFLCNRSLQLITGGRYDEALLAIDAARRFNPENPACPAIREEIQFRQHNPHRLSPSALEALSQLPQSSPATVMLEKLTPFLEAAGLSPDPQHMSPLTQPRSPFTQPLAPPSSGVQVLGPQPPHPGPADPRPLIELTQQLHNLSALHAQSQSVNVSTSPPQPTPTQPSNLQTFVGTVGLNIEHSRTE